MEENKKEIYYCCCWCYYYYYYVCNYTYQATNTTTTTTTAINNITRNKEIKNLFHLKFEKDSVYILFKLKYILYIMPWRRTSK